MDYDLLRRPSSGENLNTFEIWLNGGREKLLKDKKEICDLSSPGKKGSKLRVLSFWFCELLLNFAFFGGALNYAFMLPVGQLK
jgi:hypothetical protein